MKLKLYFLFKKQIPIRPAQILIYYIVGIKNTTINVVTAVKNYLRRNSAFACTLNDRLVPEHDTFSV